MEVGVGGGRQRHGGESHTRNQGLASESQGTPPLRCLSWSLPPQLLPRTRPGLHETSWGHLLHHCESGISDPEDNSSWMRHTKNLPKIAL